MSFTCSSCSRLCLQSNRCFRGKSEKQKKVRFRPAYVDTVSTHDELASYEIYEIWIMKLHFWIDLTK